jgi:hypothetical protein
MKESNYLKIVGRLQAKWAIAITFILLIVGLAIFLNMKGCFPEPAQPPSDSPTESGRRVRIVQVTANVREGPGTKFRVLSVVSKGTKVELIEISPDGGWAKARLLNDTVGYINRKLLGDVAPKSTTQKLKPPIRRVYVKPVNCDCRAEHGNIYIVYTDGSEKQVTKTGMCYDPQLSPDQQTVGWLLGWHFDYHGSTVFVSTELVFYRNGRIVRTLDYVNFIRDWCFWNGGKQVAVYAGGMHFSGFYYLYDIATDRVVAEWDETSENPPEWVEGLIGK